MLLPLSWLNEYVDVKQIPVEQLCKSLFSCGFEVEEVIYPGAEISGCVVGKITQLLPHPNADSLQICKIDCAEHGDDLQIITGATNVAAGQCVPVALHGATLVGGQKIKSGNLRGQPSQGMLCSGQELGIDDDWYDGAGVDGIMILRPDDKPGTDIKTLLGLDDCVLDISVTANRPDCQCVVGIAREVAAAFSLPFKTPATDYTQTGKTDDLSVRVLDQELCPRYIGHRVKDVKIAPSPVGIRRRLRLCGLGCINNIVDLTNYILLELGQPMHAFDARHVDGCEIVVRRAAKGEKIITLDEREFELTADNLLICDPTKPLALAGIMGGLHTGIAGDTTEVIFEAASFEKANIRRSARALGQNSDASKRFEKGVDDYTVGLAMQRVLHLVDSSGFGSVTGARADVWARPDKKNPPIQATIPAINAVLGIDVPGQSVADILRRLNFEVTLDGDKLTAIAPPYREDVDGCPDLAEEVIRIHGFEHLRPTMMSAASITPGGLTPHQRIEGKLRAAILAGGFSESIHFSFYSPREPDMLGLDCCAPERDVVVIENPIAEHYSVMRRTLVPSMLRTVARNCKRGVSAGRLFEFANSYIPKAGQQLPQEIPLLCLALFGQDEDYLSAKGAVEQIATAMGLGKRLGFERTTRPYLHPGRTAAILLDGQAVGQIGQLAYPVQEAFEISRPVFVIELNAQALLDAAPPQPRFSPLPAFLEVTRDLALVAGEEITNAQIQAAITGACRQVGEVKLFDVYRSEQIGQGKKSMAYTLTFTPTDTALAAEQLDGFVEKILQALGKLGVGIRA